MATNSPQSGGGVGGDKSQSIPKLLLIVAVLGVLVVIGVAVKVLSHNPGGTSAGRVGQPADHATGPQLGAGGPAGGQKQPSNAPAGPSAGAPGTAPGAAP